MNKRKPCSKCGRYTQAKSGICAYCQGRRTEPEPDRPYKPSWQREADHHCRHW